MAKRFSLLKKIKDTPKSRARQRRVENILNHIKKGESIESIAKRFNINKRTVYKWQTKYATGYKVGFRKIRTPRPKIDMNLLQTSFNSNLEDITDSIDKEFINYCNTIKKKNFFKLSEKKKKNAFKRCVVCGKLNNLIYCNKCGDGFHEICGKTKSKKMCCRCLNKIKIDPDMLYKSIKVYSIVTKKFSTVCNGKLVKPVMKDININFYLGKKKLTFCDDLFYTKNCPKEMNNYSLEGWIQKLNEKNIKIYKEFKEESKLGKYGPVEIVEDTKQGYIVKATDKICMNTIITEYSGDVFFFRDMLLMEKNDSSMELISSPVSDTSLVIVPVIHANLGRFLSGINNKKKNTKQNVYSIRVNIENSIHVLLLAKKNIEKGKTLYFDYNAGGADAYNTENFE